MDLFDRPRAPRKGEKPQADTTIEGTVERVVYSGGDGAFTVARLKVEKGGAVVTVVGSLVGVPEGAVLRVSGRFETTARFGEQFRVERYTEVAPQTIDGLRRYLGSGLIKGIGPEFASRIVDRFGIETLEILDSDPARISEVPGIGPSRARAIRQAWSAQREVRKVMVFLQGYGVSPAFAARIYKRYGAAAIARVRENPYRLAFDVWGIGFLSADKLAAALGVARDAPARAEAGVRHVLDDQGGNGHVFVPRPRLVAGGGRVARSARGQRVDPAIDRLARTGDCAIDASVVEDARARRLRGGPVPGRVRAGRRAAQAAGDAARPATEIDRERAHRLVRARGGHRAGAAAGRGGEHGAVGEGRGDHRRPGRRQDDDRARHRVDPGEEGRPRRAGRAHGPRRQAAHRRDRRVRVDVASHAGMAAGRGELRAATRPGRWSSTC